MSIKSRRSLRLNGYDYRQNGAYIVTVCAYRHANLFGSIEDGVMTPNAIGRIIAEEWQRTAELRPYVGLDVFVVMPNHLHGIIAMFDDEQRPTRRVAPAASNSGQSKTLQARSLGAIVGRFKGKVSRRAHNMPGNRSLMVWQRNYYEHIIRSEKSLQAIREYIAMNPSRWAEDSYYTPGVPDCI